MGITPRNKMERGKNRVRELLKFIAFLVFLVVFCILGTVEHDPFNDFEGTRIEPVLRKEVKKVEVKAEVKPAQKVVQPRAKKYAGSGVERWRPLVSKYFPASQVNTCLRVMACESGGNPNAVNWNDAKITGYPSSGLMQINASQNWEWNDPETNIARAAKMWRGRGWQPWSCY